MPEERLIDAYLTLQQAAECIGVSSDHLARLAAKGRIRKYRIGKRIYFTRDDLASYLRSCAVEPADPCQVGVALRHLRPKS